MLVKVEVLMKDIIVVEMMIHDDDDVVALLTPTAAAPCVAALVSLIPHIRHDLADSRDTLNRAPLRPPKLRKEARDAIADFPRERAPAPPSLRLE